MARIILPLKSYLFPSLGRFFRHVCLHGPPRQGMPVCMRPFTCASFHLLSVSAGAAVRLPLSGSRLPSRLLPLYLSPALSEGSRRGAEGAPIKTNRNRFLPLWEAQTLAGGSAPGGSCIHPSCIHPASIHHFPHLSISLCVYFINK